MAAMTAQPHRLDERRHVEKPLLDQPAGLGWEILDLDDTQRPADSFRESEPPRESRRLHSLSLREDRADEFTDKILPGSAGAGSALGVGAPGRT